MSTRVCSPPSIDIPRDNQSAALPNASASQPAPQNQYPSYSSTGTTMAPHQLSIRTGLPVARRLFGQQTDPNALSYARSLNEMNLQKDCEKYNFDFITEEPKRGRYEWERFTSGSMSVPEKTVTATVTSCSTSISEREPLLIARKIDRPPPTPVKRCSPTNYPEEVKYANLSSSSQSNKFSPIHSIPSPPSSLEEHSSPPSSPSLEDSSKNSPGSKKKLIQSTLPKYMPQSKKRTHSSTTSSQPAEKRTAL